MQPGHFSLDSEPESRAWRFSWRPDFHIINRDQLYVEDNVATYDHATGRMQQRITYVGSIANDFNLRLFPFDCHFLTISCGTGLGPGQGLPGGIVGIGGGMMTKVIAHLRPSSLQEDLRDTLESRVVRQMLEWHFDRDNVHTYEFACGLPAPPGEAADSEEDDPVTAAAKKPPDSKSHSPKKPRTPPLSPMPSPIGASSSREMASAHNTRVQGFEISLPIRRRYEWYVQKCLAIFNILVALSWGTTFFELDSTNRYDCLGAFLLSMVAFLYVVADSLPKLPFLTIFDRMVMAGFVNIGLIYLESIAVYKLEEKGYGVSAATDMLICGAIAIMYVLVILLDVRKVQDGRVRFEDEIRDRQERRRRQNSREPSSLDSPAAKREVIRKRRASIKAAEMLSFSGLHQPIVQTMNSTLRTRSRWMLHSAAGGMFPHGESMVGRGGSNHTQVRSGSTSPRDSTGSLSSHTLIPGGIGTTTTHGRTMSDFFSGPIGSMNALHFSQFGSGGGGLSSPLVVRNARTRQFPSLPAGLAVPGMARHESYGSIGSQYLHGWQDSPRHKPGSSGRNHGERVFFAGPMPSPSRSERKAAYAAMGDMRKSYSREERNPLTLSEGTIPAAPRHTEKEENETKNV